MSVNVSTPAKRQAASPREPIAMRVYGVTFESIDKSRRGEFLIAAARDTRCAPRDRPWPLSRHWSRGESSGDSPRRASAPVDRCCSRAEVWPKYPSFDILTSTSAPPRANCANQIRKCRFVTDKCANLVPVHREFDDARAGREVAGFLGDPVHPPENIRARTRRMEPD